MALPLAPIDFNKGIADVHITNLEEDFVHAGTQREVKNHAASKRSEISSNVETKTDIVVPFLKERMVQALKYIKLSRRSFLLQEENKILDKIHHQKIAEVEKLSTTVAELEEAVLAGAAAATNAVRDHQRQVQELL